MLGQYSRTAQGAATLAAAGAEVHRGDLEDLDSLRSGAAASDGVIHCGFVHDFHDFSRFQAVCEIDRHAIETMGDALAGSDRPLVITSGTAMGTAVPGQPATEDHFDPHYPNPRAASEIAAEAVAGRGVRVTVVRLPQVHNTEKQGLVTTTIDDAREKGLAAYVRPPASTAGSRGTSSTPPPYYRLTPRKGRRTGRAITRYSRART